jgi:hypothetical protein
LKKLLVPFYSLSEITKATAISTIGYNLRTSDCFGVSAAGEPEYGRT